MPFPGRFVMPHRKLLSTNGETIPFQVLLMASYAQPLLDYVLLFKKQWHSSCPMIHCTLAGPRHCGQTAIIIISKSIDAAPIKFRSVCSPANNSWNGMSAAGEDGADGHQLVSSRNT
jgi:hypothetical protein